jgi:hypothetical protein
LLLAQLAKRGENMTFHEQIIEGVQQNVANFGIDTVILLPNLITAIALLLIGIFIGKFSKWILKKILVSGFKLGTLIKVEIIDTFASIIKWVIYIVFLQSAVTVLSIPLLSKYLGTALGIISGLIGSIVILIVGYALANFLKVKLENTKLENISLLGSILFFFIVYVSLVLAIQSALVGSGEEENLSQNVILIVTALFGATIAWNYRDYLKKKK